MSFYDRNMASFRSAQASYDAMEPDWGDEPEGEVTTPEQDAVISDLKDASRDACEGVRKALARLTIQLVLREGAEDQIMGIINTQYDDPSDEETKVGDRLYDVFVESTKKHKATW